MKATLDRRAISALVIATFIVIILTVSLHGPTYETLKYHASRLGTSDQIVTDFNSDKQGKEKEPTGYDASGNERLAYLTFLSGTVESAQDEDLEKDNYFIATRIWVWQLLHNPRTKTKHDVVVMVTPTVSESRRERLRKDGAIVYAVEFLHTKHDGWIHAEQHRWDDVMTKMRAWEMTQYSRILFMDGDSMLREPLDGIFDDPGAQIKHTMQLDNVTSLPGQAPFPDTYLLGSLSEVWDSSHEFPPGPETGIKTIGYMNAGFFLLAPSKPMFEYYKSLLDIEGSFDPKYPEQNLMNYAHRWDGPMPWTEVAYTWNIRCPNEKDFEKGLVSMHEKWWKQPYIHGNQPIKDWLRARRWEMKGWYDGKEAAERV